MKYLSICLIMLILSGCAPFQVDFALYERNVYTLPSDNTSTNVSTMASDTSERAYGNNNKVVILQNMVLYKSPVTNSSNEFSATLPLVK